MKDQIIGVSGAILNEEQTAAYNRIVNQRESMLVLGMAGSGKTELLLTCVAGLKANGLSVAICAPTGVAGQAIGGCTIHRTFGLGARPLVEDDFSVPDAIRGAHVVVIDEIGMLRCDCSDAVSIICDKENKRRAAISPRERACLAEIGQPVEPLQVVAFGDFCQLSPFVAYRCPDGKRSSPDLELLKEHYGSAFRGLRAFQGKHWDDFRFSPLELVENVRQDDPDFIEALRKVRQGDPGCIDWFDGHASKSSPKNAVHVCGLKRTVTKKNDESIRSLPGEGNLYVAERSGEVRDSDMRFPSELLIKRGARVMALVNRPDEGYVNGSTGTVIEMDPGSVVVSFDNGAVARVGSETERVIRYSGKRDPKTGAMTLEERDLGQYTQLPIDIAYAMTIHKSQGATLDAISVDPYSWAEGQLYVALSRVRTVEGLHLEKPIKPQYLKSSTEVEEFYESIRRNIRLHNLNDKQ